MKPLDRLNARMDERQAKLALYPPRELHAPGSSSAIISITASDGAAASMFADDWPTQRIDAEHEVELFPFWSYP